MTKNNFKPTIVLGTICLVVALLLSIVNMITAPIIKENQNAAANEALVEVLPDGKNFKELTIDESYPKVITMGYSADGGYVFTASVNGKSSGLLVMCGIDAQGKIVSTKVLAEQETDTYDINVFPLVEGSEGKYTGMDLESFEPFLVSGATLTSRAFSEAVKAALQAYVVASGGVVDVRDPEQILQDNCNNALGTEGLTFTKWFATEVLVGIDAVYQTDGGRVYVIGESFIGVNKQGQIVGTNTDSAVSEKVIAANTVINASTLTEVTELPDTIHKNVTKAWITASGNYLFELKADGFSVHSYDEYGYGDNMPIVIKVSISSDGKIIDCLTVSHSESKGYGDKCQTEEYYESFRGTDKDKVVISGEPITGDVTDPGAIAGATFTAQGYQKAVKRAFEAFEILSGGEQND